MIESRPTVDTKLCSSPKFSDQFKIIANRQFMASGNTKYILPSGDDEEIDRLDSQHYMFRHIMHGNFSAPVEEALERGITVLDAGCGSGRWCLDMANDFPNSIFIGTDIVNTFPPPPLPPNLTFVQANTVTGLPFADGTFDFVFQRLMFLAFTPADWQAAMRELARVTKPGGWIELFESTVNTVQAPPGYDKIQDALHRVLLKRDIDVEMVREIPNLLAAQGFADIVSDYVSCPIGWQGRAGELLKINTAMFFDASRPILMPELGFDDEEYTVVTERLLQETGRYKCYLNLPYVYGMKPFV